MEVYEKLSEWVCYKWMSFSPIGYSLSLSQTLLSSLGCHSMSSVCAKKWLYSLSLYKSFPKVTSQVALMSRKFPVVIPCTPSVAPKFMTTQSPGNSQRTVCKIPDIRHFGSIRPPVLTFFWYQLEKVREKTDFSVTTEVEWSWYAVRRPTIQILRDSTYLLAFQYFTIGNINQ